MSFESLLNRLSKRFAKELFVRFKKIQAINPSESFYGIATCHEGDSYSCYLAAHSEESIRRELESRAVPGKPLSEMRTDRYWVPEWEFEDNDAFVIRLHQKVWKAAEREKVDYEVSGRKVFDAYVSGLRLFEANGGLKQFNRDQFILIPWVHDPGDENKWVLQAVDELNPQSVSDTFAAEYGYA